MRAAVFLAALLLSSCAHRVTPSNNQVAFRITREDGLVCIMQFPQGPRTIADLKKECGCDRQLCIVETIHLTNKPTK